MIVRKCLVCKYADAFEDKADEGIIRASCLPCGHQGCFDLTRTNKTVEELRNESN